jgi:hypothetical protein
LSSSIEIARQKQVGMDIFIRVLLREDGGVRFEGQDIGDRVKEIWGDDDYEYWDVSAPEIGRLLLLLLKEKYNSNIQAVEEFRGFCESNGIAHQFSTWR